MLSFLYFTTLGNSLNYWFENNQMKLLTLCTQILQLCVTVQISNRLESSMRCSQSILTVFSDSKDSIQSKWFASWSWSLKTSSSWLSRLCSSYFWKEEISLKCCFCQSDSLHFQPHREYMQSTTIPHLSFHWEILINYLVSFI